MLGYEDSDSLNRLKHRKINKFPKEKKRVNVPAARFYFFFFAAFFFAFFLATDIASGFYV
jgi:hypothetical protein